MKRKVFLCVLASAFLLFCSGCRNSMYEADQEAMKLAGTVAEPTVSEPSPEPVPSRKGYTREERNDLTQNYKLMWQEADKKITSYDMSEDSNGVKRYSNSNVLRKLEIGQDTYGTKDLSYEREYYFDEDGILYFARLTQGEKEMRFYFHEHQLLRWIDDKNNAYDDPDAHSDFEVYEIKLLSETDRLVEEFEAEQVILNSYVVG